MTSQVAVHVNRSTGRVLAVSRDLVNCSECANAVSPIRLDVLLNSTEIRLLNLSLFTAEQKQFLLKALWIE